MPAEVLVMCPACGLPQPARERCTRCGAALPESPLGTVAPEPAAPAPQSGAVIPLTGGRSMCFAEDALELREGGAARRLAFASIRRVTLQRRWSLPAIAVIVAGVFSAAVLTWWPLRLLGLVVTAAGVWLLGTASAWVMQVEPQGGAPIRVPLGSGGRRGGPGGVTAHTTWIAAAEELRRRGVEVAE